MLTESRFIVLMAKDQNSLPYLIPSTDIMQYEDASIGDTSQTLDHTSEVRDSHFHFDEAS
jgi:hypothetical protein|tara:strand:- start:295 stop:474 length:180 start_codon:yes stop_codon:yes gene_type:complete